MPDPVFCRLDLGLRKLALQRCELELLRSHPKDERGSVREIGLCDRMSATLHFLELMRLLCWEFDHCPEWSFSGLFWDPKRERKWIPKWTRQGTENDHFEQQVNYPNTTHISARKSRVSDIRSHSTISLALPLSSLGWLRDNSSSHRCSASFRKVSSAHRALNYLVSLFQSECVGSRHVSLIVIYCRGC